MSRFPLLVAVALCACTGPKEPSEPVSAQPAPPVEATPSPETSPAEEAPSATRTGIGVSGVWTLEVRDPDGTVVERRELHNSFVDTTNDLARVLARQRTAGAWTIVLQGNPIGEGICDDGGSTVLLCLITTKSDTSAGHVFPLTLTVDTHALKLEGGATAMRDGEVAIVSTQFHTCPSSTAPDACEEDGDLTLFTSATLPSPVNLTAGQTLYATALLSLATIP